MKLYHICFLVLLLFINSCSENKRLEYALRCAGSNRAELEKVLIHFEGNELKQKAAIFLIENMPFHTAFHDRIFTPDKKEYAMDISTCVSDEDIRLTFDSLMQQGYTYQREKVKDIDVISAEFLIDNIDMAFEVWEQKWARGISFGDFCQYILPYRLANEPISGLRRSLKERCLPLIDSIGASTPMEACSVLGHYLKQKIVARGASPFYASVEYVERFCQGNCEGVSVYGAFLMRAVGIPVALERTVWAKMDNGHCWLSLFDTAGQSHAFAVDKLNIKDFKRGFKGLNLPAKVYRSGFGLCESMMDVSDDGYITFVKNPLLKDVTAEYWTPVVEINVELLEEQKRAEAPIYLCAYNSNQWTELALGERIGKKCVVKNVVGDNVFRIADCEDGQNLRFITPPFYVDSIGQVSFFKSSLNNKARLTFLKSKSYLTRPHTLSYWDDSSSSFKLMEIVSEGDSSIVCNAPIDALFVLRIGTVTSRLNFIQKGKLHQYL